MKKIAFGASALAACSLLFSIAGAHAQSSLSPEQQALVRKYRISPADQQKLFGVSQSPAVQAQTVSPVRRAPARAVAPAPVSNNPLDNTYVWIGGDVYKSIGDRLTNINGGTGGLTNSFGVVGGFNTSVGIGDFPVRLQAGASYGIYDFYGRLRIVPDAFDTEKQSFFTVGLYKRGNMHTDRDPISWGIVYDVMQAQHWGINANNIDLSQVRATFGYALNESTEIGVWGSFGVKNDRAAITVAGAPGVLSTIRATDQGNLYVKQNFAFGAELTAYVGMLDNASVSQWQAGLKGQMPLNNYWSAFGNFNYVVPNAASGPNGSGLEQFNVSFGLTYYFGGNAANPSVTGNRNLPLLPVAGNSTFLVTD